MFSWRLSGIFFALVGLFAGCTSQQNEPKRILPVKIALAKQPSSALLYVALDKGFFAQHGLQVSKDTYPSGKRAVVEGLLGGSADVASCSGIPFAHQILLDQPLLAFASVHEADNVNRIVARKSAGIVGFADLVGRRLATQRNSAVHYFTKLLLEENGLTEKDVELIFLPAEKLVNGLVDGSYEAFAMREPYVSDAEGRLGENALILSSPGLYRQQELLVYDQRRAPSQDVLERILLALNDAEDFSRTHPDEVIYLVAGYIGADVAQLRTLWRTFSLRVEVAQELLVILEAEAAWVAKVNALPKKDINALKHLDLTAMRKVLPQRINLIE